MTIIEKIHTLYPEMTKSEKEISEYLISHRDDFIKKSIKDIADENGTSTTTLIRFARRLGFEGFRELKKALCEDTVISPTLTSKFNSINYMSGDRLLADTINQSFRCIEDTFTKIPEKTLDECVAKLQDARRVYTFGMKESYALSHYAYTRLYTVRNDVFILDVAHGDAESLLNITKDDTCIIFLFHRYTKTSVDVLKAIKKTGASIILITNEPVDEIEKYSDILIPCVVYGSGIKNTSIAPVCLLDYLCNVLAVKDPQKALNRFKELELLFENQETLGN
ncbi:MAG: MurR/RpiR family transcriptional regulator [Lachnospiraceae bacterium]|nr:MurR/RpiR family transcriptional regulator [Lachnospiraceae bacterium]